MAAPTQFLNPSRMTPEHIGTIISENDPDNVLGHAHPIGAAYPMTGDALFNAINCIMEVNHVRLFTGQIADSEAHKDPPVKTRDYLITIDDTAKDAKTAPIVILSLNNPSKDAQFYDGGIYYMHGGRLNRVAILTEIPTQSRDPKVITP